MSSRRESLASAAIAGAVAGSIISVPDNFVALWTGYRFPLGLLVANWLCLGLATAGICVLWASVQKRRVGTSEAVGPAPVLWLVATVAVLYVWFLDKTIQAASFRGYSTLVGVVLATGVAGSMAFLVNRALRSRSRSRAPAPPFIPTMICLAVCLVAGRYLAQFVLGGYSSWGSAAAHVVLFCAAIAVIGAVTRWLAGPTHHTVEAHAPPVVILVCLVGTVLGWWWRVPPDEPGVEVSRPSDESGGRNVILITIDTLRADRMSLFGYHRATTPELEKMAGDAMVFPHAVSPSSWTLPAHASMFTGYLSSRHGAHFVEPDKAAVSWAPISTLSDGFTTLAEILRDEGYLTSAVVANAAYLHRSFGLSQGFAHYDDRVDRVFAYEPLVSGWLALVSPYAYNGTRKPYRVAAEINHSALEWLHSRAEGPFFLFLNYMDPHHPYFPPGPFGRLFDGRDVFASDPAARLRDGAGSLTPRQQRHYDAVYDGEVAYVDAELGRLFAELRELDLYDESLIIVTSDHGEFLGEHSLWGHGVGPFEEVHRVPLIVKLPDSARAGVRDEWVSTLDVFATVLDALSLPIPERAHSQPLPLVTHNIVIEHDANPSAVESYGEAFNPAYRGIYRFPWKFIQYGDGTGVLYDLSQDPHERSDQAGTNVSAASDLRGELRDGLDLVPGAPPDRDPVPLDEEVRRRLRALGYIR